MRRPIIYVSGPYTCPDPHRLHDHVMIAKLFAQTLIAMGAYVICPHTHSHGFTGLSHEEWLELDIRLLSICDGIFMLPNWAKSPGSLEERTKAIWFRMPIFYSLKDAGAYIQRWREANGQETH